jgi:tRNA A-37 threonylcarbamoyl transferase component Bud32
MTELPRVAVRKVLSGPFRGVVLVGSILDQFLQNGGEPDVIFQNSDTFLKSGRSTRSALVQLDSFREGVGSHTLYVKELRYKSIVHSLKPIFRKHRAQVMWQVSWHLLNHGISVPQPQGYLLERRGPFFLKGFFFSEIQQSCLTLDELCKNLDQLIERFDSGGLLETLAGQTAKMHDSHATHGDLKWSNVLVHEKKNKLWFVDLDAAELYGRPPTVRKIARDLARFVLSGLEAGVEEETMEKFLDQYARYRKLSRKSIDGPTKVILKKLKDRHEKKYGVNKADG